MIYIYRHYGLDGAACELLLRYRELIAQKETAFEINVCSPDTLEDMLKAPFISPLLAKVEEVWFLDICPSRSDCIKLNELYKENKFKIMLIEHRKRNEWVKQYPWAALNTEKCSARILIEELGFNVPYMIELLNAVEAWVLKQFDSPYRKQGEDLYALYNFVGSRDFIDYCFYSFDKSKQDPEYGAFPYILKKLQRKDQKYVKDIIDSQLEQAAYLMDKNGLTYKILLATEQHDKIGQAALKHSESQDLKYVVVANPLNNKCSLYSREDSNIDVSLLVKNLGGNGHKHAAVFFTNLKRLPINEIANLF